MTTPAPPPPGGGNGIEVNKDNVLAARKVILEAAEDARARLQLLQVQFGVQSPPRDPVSKSAASEWNANLLGSPDSHFNRLMQYVTHVQELGKQLEDAAKQYGYTDEEIAASFQAQEQKP